MSSPLRTRESSCTISFAIDALFSLLCFLLMSVAAAVSSNTFTTTTANQDAAAAAAARRTADPASSSSSSPPPPSVYPVDEYFFDAVVDHYSFRNPRTFPLRYYVNEQHWKSSSNNNNNNKHGAGNKNITTTTTGASAERRLDEQQQQQGPVFFYAGNEADIFQFVNNSGFMFEAAEEFGAMVVFAEHRYYGLSIPDHDDLSFLTVEQAMADFNTLTVHMRNKWNMSPQTAFIAFGGSYGGNLAMWLRLKNPNIWAGAIASSATPLKHLLRDTNGFARIETQAYGNVSSVCPDLVRQGWKELYEYAATASGCFEIADALDLCSGSIIRAELIHGWVSEALETLGMLFLLWKIEDAGAYIRGSSHFACSTVQSSVRLPICN